MATDKIRILVQAEVAKAIKDLNKVNKQQKGIEKTNKGMGESMLAVWGSVAAGITATIVAIKKAFDFALEFAEFQQSVDAMVSRFGVNAGKMIRKLQEVSDGTIFMKDAVLAANRAMALGVSTDIDQIAKLLEVARIRAKNMGITTTQAFDDIVTGIGRQSPLILDNLGIITKGWAEEAKSAGQAFDAQFVLNKVLADGEKILAKTGKQTLSAAEKFQKMGAQAKDTRLLIGKLLLEQIEPLIDSFINIGDESKKVEVVTKIFRGMAIVITSVVSQLKIIVGVFRTVFAPATGTLIALVETIFALADKDIPKAKEAIKGIGSDIGDEFMKGLNLIKTGVVDTINAVKKFDDDITGIIEEGGKKRREKIVEGAQLTSEQLKELQNIENQFFKDKNLEKLENQQETLQKMLENETITAEQRAQIQRNLDAVEQSIAINRLKRSQLVTGQLATTAQNFNNFSMALIKRRVKAGLITEKEAARKMALVQHATAVAGKAHAITSAIINTLVAATSALKAGPIAGPILAAIIKGLGFINVGLIAAQPLPPIPSFQQGGVSTGGRVLVGEAGPEIAELPQGTRIIDNRRTEEILNNDNRNINITVQATDPIEFVNDLKRTYGVEVFT